MDAYALELQRQRRAEMLATIKAVELSAKKILKIDSDAYIRQSDGWLVCEERNWRHGSVGTDVLDKNPSAQVVAVLTKIDELKELLLKEIK